MAPGVSTISVALPIPKPPFTVSLLRLGGVLEPSGVDVDVVNLAVSVCCLRKLVVLSLSVAICLPLHPWECEVGMVHGSQLMGRELRGSDDLIVLLMTFTICLPNDL